MSQSVKRRLILLILALFLINLVVLDVKVFFKQKQTASDEKAPLVKLEGQVANLAGLVSEVAEGEFCPEACLGAVSQATASNLMRATPLSKAMTAESNVKEFYIPLGTGSTTSTDWVELIGVEAVVDMANYPNIKSAIFEASMRVPTANGKVYAKLYNVTDQHDAWHSEVSAEGSSGYRAEAKGIVLAPGRKVYRVMMKSTMGYEAILDSARIKILLK